MRQPTGQWEQYEGKAYAEMFRGSGWWPLQENPCRLEPPYDVYDRTTLNAYDCYINQWDAAWQPPSLLSRLTSSPNASSPDRSIKLPTISPDPEEVEQLVPIVIEQFPEDEATILQAEQLLLSMSSLTRPVAFEVLGLGPQPIYADACEGSETLEARRENRTPTDWHEPTTTVQFVTHRHDAKQLENQLLAYYPNSAVVVGDKLHRATDLLPGHDMTYELGFGSSLVLTDAYLYPIKLHTKLDNDPLGVAIATMEQLKHYEWAILQVLFTPTVQPWADTLHESLRNPYHQGGDYIFADITDSQLQRKFATPLFAVTVHIAALRQEHYLQLRGWAKQFEAPPQAIKAPNDDQTYGDIGWTLMDRCTFRPGFLLNTSELSGLVHLPGPSVTSDRLRRVKSRTKAAPAVSAEPGSIVLGENVHRGVSTEARISGQLRPRHCYIAGASGTGKSTLLLNMIAQDIAAGYGVGVIDPHGDLIDGVISLIPEQRVDDVAYFNPTDTDHPPAFNILAYHDKADRHRVVSDTLSTIESSTKGWGPRLEHILRYALTTILKSRSATLYHLHHILIDPTYRQFVVDQLKDEKLQSFWLNEFDKMPKDAVLSITNKIGKYILDPLIRNIICQSKDSFNLDYLINNNKIFLANLSKGSLGKEYTGILGTYIMSKMVAAAFRRDQIPEDDRVPFYLYVDEFQNFMDLSIGFEDILSEARKYRLVLAGLANQYVHQLSPEVHQAVFGNVGTLLTFRLGVPDARMVASEFGDFTPAELLSLKRGQAICRLEVAGSSFNLSTPPPPPKQPDAIRKVILERSRQKYTTPRAKVEQVFEATATPPRPAAPPPPKRQPAAAAAAAPTSPPPPPPPPEFLSPDALPDDADDFVT